METNSIDYGLKYVDRSQLHNLYEKKGECDDILIVKNGFITDTSYANIVFFDGQNWITPATPLLQGTCRARLLHTNLISEATITPTDVQRFKGFQLVNAMLDFDIQRMIRIENIYC